MNVPKTTARLMRQYKVLPMNHFCQNCEKEQPVWQVDCPCCKAEGCEHCDDLGVLPDELECSVCGQGIEP